VLNSNSYSLFVHKYVNRTKNISDKKNDIVQNAFMHNAVCVVEHGVLLIMKVLCNVSTYYGDPCRARNRVLLQELIVTRLVKKFPASLWKRKFHYRDHKSAPLYTVLSKMKPVHSLYKIHVILSSCMPSLSRGLFPSGIPTRILY
jgi:hypothetical protein